MKRRREVLVYETNLEGKYIYIKKKKTNKHRFKITFFIVLMLYTKCDFVSAAIETKYVLNVIETELVMQCKQ